MAKTKKTVETKEIKNVPALKVNSAELTPFIPDANADSERWCQPLIAEIKFNNQCILTVEINVESSESAYAYVEIRDPMTNQQLVGDINLQ